MKGYVVNLEQETLGNNSFRKVLYTAQHSQLVLMSLLPGEDIGMEVHTLDQFIRIDSGNGKAILNDIEYELKDGYAVVVPAGAKHNIINTSTDTPMKLYTVYSPPEHQDGIERATKAEAEAREEHFDGKTTESNN
ncbi:MAG: cupin domain-containing protein [Candidatus Komeilibacteria bacterium]